MATKKGITVIIDRPRQLRFTMNAICATEELLGRNILDIDLARISMSEMRAMIFAAMWDDDREITPTKAGDLADAYEPGYADLMGKVSEALKLAFETGAIKNV